MDSHLRLPERDTEGSFVMPVDNVVTVPGRGCVAIGTVKRGRVKKGDQLEICGFGQRFKTNAANMQVRKVHLVLSNFMFYFLSIFHRSSEKTSLRLWQERTSDFSFVASRRPPYPRECWRSSQVPWIPQTTLR